MNTLAHAHRFPADLPSACAGAPRRPEILLAVCVVFWLAAGTFLQDYLFRLVPGTISAFAAILLVSGIVLIRGGLRIRTDGPFPALYVFLLASGFAVLLSFMDYPKLADLPRSDRFIFRQSYFIVILPAAICTGIVLWRGLYARLYDACARHFVVLAMLFAIADLGTAYFLGNPLFRSFNGYSQFADKLVGSFIFTFIYLARATHPSYRSVILPLVLLTGYFGATKLLTYGSLFQASTGFLIYAILLMATLMRRHVRLAALALIAMLAGLVAFAAVGTVDPELFQSDVNSYWRFANWQSNFISLHETGYLGVGFGTPYFSLQSNDFQHALNIYNRGADPWTSSADPYDLVFLRAQHNSFINMYFRTGLIGGLAFTLFNVVMVAGILRGIARGCPLRRAHLLLALVMVVIAIIQAMLHVGIETPGFLIAYGVLAGLVVELAWPPLARAPVPTGKRMQ